VEPYRLKVRVGTHEFEAEGSQEAVERQFALWREMIAAVPASTPELPSPPPPLTGGITPTGTATNIVLPGVFDKIFRRDGRVITLTVLPAGDRREQDAALLILLGQQLYNGEEQVTGQTLLDGLKRSGLPIERADRMFGDYMDQYVLRSGIHRAVRYRLTNPGVTKAKELGTALVAMVP
jgi:hypothetical protein